MQGIEGAERMATRLQKFTEGTFAGFLNQPTNVPLDNQLTVFSIRDMEDELRPIAMYLVLNHIWTQIRRNLRKRLLVVDEAWWVMKFPVGADFLFNIAKRGRKYYTGMTTISQDVNDFMESTQGKAIVTNSSMQILMKQSPASIDIIQNTFNLTDSEKYYLLEARVGYGLFFLGANHVGIRVVASYAEDQIITSDPRQLLELEKAKQEWAELGK
jgi:type IV secretory pathway VirB4 component